MERIVFRNEFEMYGWLQVYAAVRASRDEPTEAACQEADEAIDAFRKRMPKSPPPKASVPKPPPSVPGAKD